MATIIGATLTNDGMQLLARLAGAGQDQPFNTTYGFVAVGTGSTTPSATDHQLNAEATTAGSRKVITSCVPGTNPGEFIVTGTLQATDAVGVNIFEVGWFAGSGATSSANTGVLVARVLWAHTNKLNTEIITFVLDMTI